MAVLAYLAVRVRWVVGLRGPVLSRGGEVLVPPLGRVPVGATARVLVGTPLGERSVGVRRPVRCRWRGLLTPGVEG